MFSPLRNTHSFSIKLNDVISSHVSHLLSMRSPSTVVFAVVSVIINSVQRAVIWAIIHIRKEHSVVIPFRTNFNPPATIKRIGRKVGVIAPVPHSHPHSICSCFGQFVRTSNAPTRFNSAIFQRTSSDISNFAALAFAYPSSFSANPNSVHCGKIAKCLSSKIKSFHAASITQRLVT